MKIFVLLLGLKYRRGGNGAFAFSMALEKGRSEGKKTMAKWTHEDRKHFVDLGERMITELIVKYNNGELMPEKKQIPWLFGMFEKREVQRQYGKHVIAYTKNRLTNRFIAISKV